MSTSQIAPRPAVPSTTLERGRIVVYRAGVVVPESDLTDLGDPAALGGTALEGDPCIAARVDHARGSVSAGVFRATRGRVRIHFPFTEHATILDGEVRLTDEWGNRRTLGPGDGYLIRQGSEILWEVSGPHVQKTFLNRRDAADAPGPMVVYRARDVVAPSALADLGAPERLGGTVLSGRPAISARLDLVDAGAGAGVFQATRGDARITFPFTEHATVVHGAVALTDATGGRAELGVGDSYLVRQGSPVLWEVERGRVQKAFFNLVEA